LKPWNKLKQTVYNFSWMSDLTISDGRVLLHQSHDPLVSIYILCTPVLLRYKVHKRGKNYAYCLLLDVTFLSQRYPKGKHSYATNAFNPVFKLPCEKQLSFAKSFFYFFVPLTGAAMLRLFKQ
jgi:hypothetical protein